MFKNKIVRTTARPDCLYTRIQGRARHRDAGGGAGLNVYLAEGDDAGFGIDRASCRLGLTTLETDALPTETTKGLMAKRAVDLEALGPPGQC